ncbi:MAG: hypothetical protein ACXVEU_12935 [Nocardioidaceae bacterium]
MAVQRIVSGYALTFGLTLVAGGRIGDLVGRRRACSPRRTPG